MKLSNRVLTLCNSISVNLNSQPKTWKVMATSHSRVKNEENHKGARVNNEESGDFSPNSCWISIFIKRKRKKKKEEAILI